MEWLLHALIAPVVLAPVAAAFGRAGRGEFLRRTESGLPSVTSLAAGELGPRKLRLTWMHANASALFRILQGESADTLLPVPCAGGYRAAGRHHVLLRDHASGVMAPCVKQLLAMSSSG